MRRTLFALLLLGTGCIAGGGAAVQRDDRLLREINRQGRWAQQAIDAKPAKDQLESIRSSDFASVGAARKEFTKLVQAIDRGTWIREATAEMLRDDPGDPQLVQEFDRGGRIRTDAVEAAGDLADALAEAHGGLTFADLRPAFDSIHKAQASEDRLAKQPAAAGRPKLNPAPVAQPFHAAAARLVTANPELAKELDRLPPDDQTKIRARLGDLDRQKEEQKHAEPPPAAPSAEKEAEAPSDTLRVAHDAQSLLAKKPPRSITLREDGLFALAYDDGVYLVDPDGKLVRKEAPGGDQKAPPPPPSMGDKPAAPPKK